MQMDNSYLRKLNERHLQFFDFKKIEFIARVYTASIFNDNQNSIPAISLRRKLKPLFGVNFSNNSTKTIRLFALDFYEFLSISMGFFLAFGLINHHHIEISSSKSNCYLTNRFYVVVHLFSNRSQMMSKYGKNKTVAHEAIAECVTDVLTKF